MEPRSSSRTYGAVDDSLAKRVLSGHDEELFRTPQSNPQQASAKHGRGKHWVALGAICAVAVGSVLLATRSGSQSEAGSPMASSEDSNLKGTAGDSSPMQRISPLTRALDTLQFEATNFYHTRDGKPAQDYPWLRDVKLVEPHRETTLTVTNPREGCEYRWEIRNTNGEGDLLSTAAGAEAMVFFEHLDENVVHLEERDSSGVVSRVLQETVMCKYVRREIRTLTDDEREELFDSMFKLWDVRVQGGPGKELYGEDYADIWAINRLHYAAASALVCDHFHDGLGFLTNHALISNTFEYSLQRVNPKLTLPYWDFTIEVSSASEYAGDPEPQAKSPIFTESWFGSHDPTDSMVKDGRWAYTPIPNMRVNNPSDLLGDVYNKLRAPWNVNDRAYLARGLGELCGDRAQKIYPWPTCESHYKLTTEYNSFYSWVWESAYDPHGTAHLWVGGVLDCEETYAKIVDLVGEDIAAGFVKYAFVHRKNLFRNKVFKCASTADVSIKPGDVLQSGTCGCLDYNLDSGDDWRLVIDQMVFASTYLEGFDDDTKREVVATVCNGVVNDGDHLQASSSLDPSFWPMHPTMERLFLYKRLTGTMTDLTWPDEDVTIVGEDGSIVRESLSLYSEDCEGHRGSDVFPYGLVDDSTNFKVRTGIRGNSEGNTLTNREILEIMDPRANALSYVYDNFDWTHCAADGYDFKDAWGDASEDAERPAAPIGNTIQERMAGNSPVFRDGDFRFPLYSAMRRDAANSAHA